MKHCTEAHCRFALELFKLQVSESRGENVAVCPMGLEIALAVILLGSGKTTADEIKKVLHFWDWPETVTPTDEHDSGTDCDKHGGIHRRLRQVIKILMHHSKYHMLQMSSRIYGSKAEDFLAQFIECAKQIYNSDFERVDFRNPDESRHIINSWVERETKGDVKNFFPPHSLDPSTTTVLLNIMAFKGTWNIPFNPRDTQKQIFWTCQDQSIYVDMMTRKGRFNVSRISNPAIQVVQIPCANDEFSVFIFLPENRQTSDEAIGNLTVDVLQQSTDPANMTSIVLNLSLPRFKIQTKNAVNSILSKMGLNKLFTPGQADLSGMIGNNQAFVSRIDQSVKLTVNENGVEAAGVSRTEILDGTSRDVIINKDFFLMVKHTGTACIMFLARICVPSWKE